MTYRELSSYLKERYSVRTQRISLSYFTTCPNRDGTIAKGGCTFCEESGSGFANPFGQMDVRQQMLNGMEHARKKYKAEKFIAYFQSFTNTYASLNELREVYLSALMKDVVALDISTRPDTFPCEVAELLKEISVKKKVDIFVEFGLESINENTLFKVNRGHSVAEFVDAVQCAKKYGFEVIAHVILDFPYDTIHDVIGCAKLVSVLKVNGVKMHSLYIPKDSPLAKEYLNGNLKMLKADEYVRRAVKFLSYLSPEVVIHRLISTPPMNALWSVGLTFSEAKKMIVSEMTRLGKKQGSDFNYLNGASWRKKFGDLDK